MRISDIRLSGVDWDLGTLEFPRASVVALVGGSIIEREHIIRHLLYAESEKRERFANATVGDCRSRRSKKSYSIGPLADEARYADMISVIALERLVDRNDSLGHALLLGDDLRHLFSSIFEPVCGRCSKGLIDGSLEAWRNRYADTNKLSSDICLAARFRFPGDISAEDRVSRALALFRYAASHGYKRCIIPGVGDTEEKGGEARVSLGMYRFVSAESSEVQLDPALEAELKSARAIDLVIDLCPLHKCDDSRMQAEWQRLQGLGCNEGVLRFITGVRTERMITGTLLVGDFLLCSSCHQRFTREEISNCWSDLFQKSSRKDLRLSFAYGALDLRDLLESAFYSWSEKLDTVAEENKLRYSCQSIWEKLHWLKVLDLDRLCFKHPAELLSSGEFAKSALLRACVVGLTDALIVIEEPTRFLTREEEDSFFELCRHSSKQGLTVLISARERRFADNADWVIELSVLEQKYAESNFERGQLIAYQGPVSEMMRASSIQFSGQNAVNREVVGGSTIVDASELEIFVRKTLKEPQKSECFLAISGRSGSGKTRMMRRLVELANRGEFSEQRVFRGVYLGWDDSSFERNKFTDVGDILNIKKDIANLFVSACFRAKGKKKLECLSPQSFLPRTSSSICPHCGGTGSLYRLRDEVLSVVERCVECRGSGFNVNLERLRYRGVTVAEIYSMSLIDLMSKVRDNRKIVAKLSSPITLGLGHLALGASLDGLGPSEIRLLGLCSQIVRMLRRERILIALDQVFCGLDVNSVEMWLRTISRVNKYHSLIVLGSNEPIAVQGISFICLDKLSCV